MAEETTLKFDQAHHLDDSIKRRNFPDNFLFGVGTSAHQVEGAWNTGGKGMSIWDCFTLRNPDKIAGGANACVAADSYSRIKEDVQLLRKMGVNSFRFSISWSRILPGGKVNMGKNQEGINYYNKLIDESDFVNYADICFWEFGDRVKNWLTVNEPRMFIHYGYVTGTCAPGRGEKGKDNDLETEPYTVAYNLLNCHAAVYRKYEKDYKGFQKGKVGITLHLMLCKPYRGPSNQQDVKAVEYAFDFMNGWFLEPLTTGTWPQNMQKFATTPTAKFPNGRTLPKFSDDQRTKLIDSYDFLGINYYTANYAQYQAPSSDIPLGYATDCHYKALGKDPNEIPIGKPAYPNSEIYLCANELTELLYRVKSTYNVSKPIIITENGSPDKNDFGKTYEQVRDDAYRMEYIEKHLIAIRTAMRNNINVMGYFVWSFMDCFEWPSGYSNRYGMIYVDYAHNLQRYPKSSAIWFRKFLSKTEGKLHERALMDGEEEDEVNNTVQAEMIPTLKKTKNIK
ncbi:hypothetical protein OSB04_010906 [Centaurea solstitialis]|uniref:Beta-glucosidase n=1 Tax=Centaurea solstitialis TaxID=347529 RepID=A0AA38WD85_9ASTR|nr:hypothetical protein OSB04_010906 [Centaurea solstitialis]